MASKATASLLFLLVANLIASYKDGVSAAETEPTCLTMTAAVKTGNILFFFYGQRYIGFDSVTLKERHKGWARDFFQLLPNGFSIDAAFTPVGSPNIMIVISNGTYIAYSTTGRRRSTVMPLSNVFPRSNNFAQGIDAAVTFNGVGYFFKGCTLVQKKGARVRVLRLPRLHLPCSIDAAWVNRGRIVISKGPYAWLMKGLKKLNSRPLCFANSFKTDVNICKCVKKAA